MTPEELIFNWRSSPGPGRPQAAEKARKVEKYSPDQPRDDHGRFASVGGSEGSEGSDVPPKPEGLDFWEGVVPATHMPYAEIAESVELYHGTTSQVLDAIKKEGLIPHKSPGGTEWAKEHGWPLPRYDVGGRAMSIYLTEDKWRAQGFARMVSEMRHAQPVTLKITLPPEMAHRVKYDERGTSSGPTTDYLRLEGRIPPQYIEVVDKAQGGKAIYAVLLCDGQAQKVSLARFLKGDVPGHEFHGNQWTGGEGEAEPIGNYRGPHEAADHESGAPLHDLTGSGRVYPDDVYSANGLRYYGTGEDRWDARMYAMIQQFKGRPNMLVTVYRAVPKDAKGGINAGDWVTPIRAYAVEHGEGRLNGEYRVTSRLVHARDIFTSGDSWLEWGYDPQPRAPKVAKGDFEGHPFRGNQYTGGIGGEIASLFERLSKPDGGFTVNPLTGVEPKTGYAVSPYPERSFAKSDADMKPADLAHYMKANLDAFAKDDHFLGGWHDPESGKIFLDISVVSKTPAEAEALCRKHDQIAYFDLSAGKSVTVDRSATSGGVARSEHGSGHEAGKAEGSASFAEGRRTSEARRSRLAVRKAHGQEGDPARAGRSPQDSRGVIWLRALARGVIKGDFEGHPFRGNQYTGGIGGEDSTGVGSGAPEFSEMMDDQGRYHVWGNVDLAVRLIGEGRDVVLEQRREVSTLMDKLAEIGRQERETGAPHKVYDLCHVSVQDTNLFCAESAGYPRVKMPQLGGFPAPGSLAETLPRTPEGGVDITDKFIEHLRGAGFNIDTGVEDAAYLRPSQMELDGSKVAGIMGAIQAGTLPKDIPMVISRDNYIIDGHHRWAAKVALEYSAQAAVPIDIHRVDIGVVELIDTARKFASEWGIPQLAPGAFKYMRARLLAKFRPDQERDEHGRFADEGKGTAAAKEPRGEYSHLTADEMISNARDKFGITANPRIGGYILPTGEMLNFGGGRKEYRGYDHRQISDALGGDLDGTLAMIEFASTTGSVRMHFAGDGNYAYFQFFKAPTEAQLETVHRIGSRAHSVQWAARQSASIEPDGQAPGSEVDDVIADVRDVFAGKKWTQVDFAKLDAAFDRIGRRARLLAKYREDQVRDDHGRFADEGKGEIGGESNVEAHILPTDSHQRAVHNLLDWSRGHHTEALAAISPNGVPGLRAVGDRYSIQLSSKEKAELKGMDVIHNHPSEEGDIGALSLSGGDVGMATACEARSVIAVSEDGGVYSASDFPTGRTPSGMGMQMMYAKDDGTRSAYAAVRDMELEKGIKISSGDAQRIVSHASNLAATELGMYSYKYVLGKQMSAALARYPDVFDVAKKAARTYMAADVYAHLRQDRLAQKFTKAFASPTSATSGLAGYHIEGQRVRLRTKRHRPRIRLRPVYKYSPDQARDEQGRFADEGKGGSKDVQASAPELERHNSINEVAEWGRATRNELGVVYNPKTGERILRVQGGAHSVRWSDEECKLMRGMVLVHNHPGAAWSLSGSDLSFAAAHGLSEITAIAADGSIYSASPVEGETFRDVERAYDTVQNAVNGILVNGYMKGELSETHANILSAHVSNEAMRLSGHLASYTAKLGPDMTEAMALHRNYYNKSLDAAREALGMTAISEGGKWAKPITT